MSTTDSPPQNSTGELKTAGLSPPPPPISPPSPPLDEIPSPTVLLPASSNSSPPSPLPPVSPPPPLLSPPPTSGSPSVQASAPPPSPSSSKSPSPPPSTLSSNAVSPSPPPPPPPTSSSSNASPPPPPPPPPVAANPTPPLSGGQQSQPSPSPPPPSNKNPTPISGSPKLSPPPPPFNPQQSFVPSPVIYTPGSPLSKSPPPSKLYSPSVVGRAPPPPSTTRTTNLSPPSKSAKSPPTGSKSHRNSETPIAVGIAGIFVIGVIAFMFFTLRRKNRSRERIYTPQYVAPANFSMKPNGNFYIQQQSMVNSGPAEGFYSQPPPSSFVSNAYESQRTNTYNGAVGGTDSSGVISNAKTFFTHEELMQITNGFSRQNILGEGGFGCVYKGWLPDGKVVAVKSLKAGSGQGEREFRAEVEIISRVHHRHLVSLVGYCISDQNRLLIYEFVPNKTLEYHLHGKGLPVLSWSRRVKIALGSAKGLAYLHEDCHPKIIHRDIKSANILLDDTFEAQVADFGLAKLTNDTSTHVSTRVMGTFGYLAPEYASSGKLTDRSDVFSYGVVLLELITGRKPVDTTRPLGDESLVEWARPLLIDALETLEFRELIDPRLEKHYVESEMLRMIEAAAACIRHSAQKRPRMAQVVRSLDSDSEMSDLSNGVKFGQSTMYDSGQYDQDINRFRKMALGLSKDSSEYNIYSGEDNSRELLPIPNSSNYRDNSSGESETRAFNTHSNDRRYTPPPIHFNNRRF